MALRSIQQFVIHVESFRNIDLWYQGVYLMKFRIFKSTTTTLTTDKNTALTLAHPFAHTENYHPNEQSTRHYDSQIVKTAFIQQNTSSFFTKSFLLRYFQQEVQLNDICHFRIETDISKQDTVFTLEASLIYFDQQNKRIEPEEINGERGRVVKCKTFQISNTVKGIHEYFPVIFDSQYYSIANITLHTLCLDYRFRLNLLQLSQFVKLTQNQKAKLIEKNKKLQTKKISYFQITAKQLGLPAGVQSLSVIEDIIITGMKTHYQTLLKQYTRLFYKVITQAEKKVFSNILVPPEEICLFQDEQHSFIKVSFLERIEEKYKTKNAQNMFQKMLNQTNLISSELMKLWHSYIDIIKISPRFTEAFYQRVYTGRETQFWQKLYQQMHITTPDICLSHHQPQPVTNNTNNNNTTNKYNIESEEFMKRKGSLPFIQENIYSYEEESSLKIGHEKYVMKIHLIVFTHGFQGNSFDMKLIKNNIAIMFPEAMFLCSSSNEDLTDNDIGEMGNRLASEVRSYIFQNFPNDTLGRLSFVGHSLGGIIIRTALQKLLQFKDKFYTFISFSSPHLGYSVNTSSVVGAGMWLLQKMKNSYCLKQLAMSDHNTATQTFLYKLSLSEGLQYFQHILLFSSKQDSYAPYQSARIQIDPAFMSANDPLKDVHCQMVRNILRRVSSGVLHRLDVQFKIQQTNLDSLIGRTAHIMFLESPQLIRSLVYTHKQLFQ